MAQPVFKLPGRLDYVHSAATIVGQAVESQRDGTAGIRLRRELCMDRHTVVAHPLKWRLSGTPTSLFSVGYSLAPILPLVSADGKLIRRQTLDRSAGRETTKWA